MKQGFVYIATGEKYIREAIGSVTSLRRVSPKSHATLITDRPTSSAEFDAVTVIPLDAGHGKKGNDGIGYKVVALQHSPYEKTLFVDTDTFFCDACDELFDLLDFHDLLICHAPADRSQVCLHGRPLAGYLPYNTGVLAYRKTPAIRKLFDTWLTIYTQKHDMYPHDQTPLMEALLSCPVKLYVLPALYNLRLPFYATIHGGPVKILHGRSPDLERIAKRINAHGVHRVWLPDRANVRLFGNLVTRTYLKTPQPLRTAYRFCKRHVYGRFKPNV